MGKLFDTIVERVWVPIEEAGGIAEAGFAPEPIAWDDHEIFADDNKCRPLSYFAGTQCLVLLGDPGLGKTTALKSAFELGKAAGEIAEFLDLSTIEATEEIGAAIPSAAAEEVFLYLDSLDEGRLSIKQLFNKIVPYLGRLPKEVQSRLKVRLTCRTVEWTDKIDTEIKGLFGEQNVKVLQLAPFRLGDAKSLVSTDEKIDPNAFLAEVERTHAEALAARPITLKFLVNEFRKSNKFPTRIVELYERGMEFLASEHSDSRRNLASIGALSSIERIAIARRLATYTVLTNSARVSLKDSEMSGAAIGLGDLAQGSVAFGGARLTMSRGNVEEVLQSALFTLVPEKHVQWAHKGFAEFLTASDLAKSGLDADEQHALLVGALEPDGEVVPQLSGVAIWLASMERNYLLKLAESDPQLVLRADLADADAKVRERIVETYLGFIAAGRAHDFEIGIWPHLQKLRHPMLAVQLRTYMNDRSLHLIARRAAIDIAEANKEEALRDDLLSIALDERENRNLRKEALGALLVMSSIEVAKRIRPLTGLGEEADPDDELRGPALALAWPSAMSTAEMLTVLEPPRRENLIGSYKRFIWEMPKALPAEDIETALEWMRGKVQGTARGSQVDYDFQELAGGLVARASHELSARPSLMMPLADLIAELMTNHHWHDWRSRGERRGGSVFGDPDVRRMIAVEVSRRLGESQVFWILHVGLLNRDEDLRFVWEKLSNARSADEAMIWDTIAWTLTNAMNPEEFQEYYNAALKHAALSARLSERFGPIDIYGESAARLRKTHLLMKEKPDESRKPTIETIDGWIDSELQKVLTEKNFNSWWVCFSNRWLMYDPERDESDSDDHVDFYDLPRLPAYRRASIDRREMFVQAAKVYVAEAPHDHDAWWHTPNEYGWRSLAAFGALLLLEEVERKYLESLGASSWEKWVPIVVAEEPNNQDARRRRGYLMGLLQATVPELLVATIRERASILIEAHDKSGHFSLGALMPREWSDELIHVASEILTDIRIPPRALKAGVRELAIHSHASAEALCENAFQQQHIGDAERKRAAVCIAGLLEGTNGKSWSIYGKAVLGDKDLLEDTLCAMGE